MVHLPAVRSAPILLLVVGLAACSPNLAVPDEAALSCTASESCPTGWVCNLNLNLCVKADGLDTSAPTLTGAANPAPAVLRRAGKSVLALDASEPLLGVPTVMLETTPPRPFTFESATSSGQHYEFSYVAAGDEPTDVDVPVSIHFIDLSGNVATASRSLRFDFLPPAANAIAVTGSPATSGATVRLTFTASEPLQADPVVALDTGAPLVADHSVAPPNYAYQYVATGSEPTTVHATLHLIDGAGNTADVPVPTALAFDTVPPALDGPAEIVTPIVRESFTALVRLTVSEPLAQDPQVVLDPGDGGTPIPLTVGAQVGTAYTLEHRVTAADPDGVYTVRLGSLEDLAHNTLAPQTLGAIAIDKVAPGLTGSVALDKPDPLYKAGDTVTLQFDATEPLASPPVVQLSSDTSADAPFACASAGNHFTCTRPIVGSEPEGPLGITIQLEDQAGNIGFGTSSLVLDFTPPVPVAGNIQLLPGPGNLLQQVSAVGSGTTVQATFSMSEPVSGTPIVTASKPSPLAFSAQASPGGYLFTFQCDGGQREGTYDLQVTATDLAGNTSTVTLSDPAFTIDETRPSSLGVGVPDRVVYHRNPFGTSTPSGPSQFWVELLPNSTAPDNTVIIYDGANPGTAKELGRASPPGAGQSVTSVPLDLSDHTSVYALTVDGAGNHLSQASQVNDLEWVVSLGGKVPGSTYENPTSLVVSPNLLPSLDQSPNGAAEPTGLELAKLATVDGQGLSAPAQGVWRQQIPARPSPEGGSNWALALDPVRGKLVLFGGGRNAGNETWELDLRSRTWTPRTPATGSPPPRIDHALVGSGGGMVYLFGGTTGSGSLNDVWAWDGASGTWTQLVTKGTAPLPREFAQVAIDSERNKLVVFGGHVSSGFTNDLWELDLATLQWTNRTPSPLPASWPAPRDGGLLTFVPSLHTLVMVGDNAGTAETWELDPVALTWTARPAPPWGYEPYVQGAFDRLRGALYVLDSSTTGVNAQHLYRYDPGTPAWTDVTAASIPTPWPRERMSAAAAADPVHGGVIFFGGLSSGAVDADTWLLNSATELFSNWTPAAAAPEARWGATSAFDSDRGRWLVFGGRTQSFSETNELWEWDPSGVSWTDRTPSSLPSSWAARRLGAGMAYDPYRKQMLMFGGWNNGGAVNYLDQLDPVSGTWTSVTVSGTVPTARVNPVVVFNPQPAPGKLYILGGSTSLGGTTGVAEFDVCTFSGFSTATCSTLPLNASGAPTVFAELTGALGVNPANGQRRLVVFGGVNASGVQNQELHEFDGTSWTSRPKTATWPSTRSRAALAFSQRRNKFLLFGGYQAGVGELSDVWEWDSASGSFTPISTGGVQPAGRDWAVLAFSPGDDTFTLFSGELAATGTLASDETWELSLPAAGRPGAVWTVPFASAGPPPTAVVRSITATVNAAGTGTGANGAPQNGAAMSIWSSAAGSWVQVGSNGAPNLSVPAPVTFATTDPSSVAAMLTGPQQTVAIAATPAGLNRTGRPPSTVLLDYLELSIRYRLR